ncbi:delta-aminolevulinic acid dehydratase [Cryptococcus neoformans AD1-7a]|nr:delta-aminolevulinic acid dehydratase [Cryptococcus neoformans var. grubii AD1-7a]
MLPEARLLLAIENAINYLRMLVALLDELSEGADILMVKPALPYLDIISDCAQYAPDHPTACYQVSGEYAMVVAGAEKGIYGLREMAFETTESMVRAGNIILTYFTPQFLDWLDE